MRNRARFIGGSDVAGVLGVSPWDTPLDVYLAKTGQKDHSSKPDLRRERLFRRGKLLEPIALKMLVQDFGVKITKRSLPSKPNRYKDPHVPYFAAEVDFEWEVQAGDVERWHLDPKLLGTIQNGEVKTVHHFAAAKFGDAETEDVPIEYAAQAMHGLGVTGRRLTLFATLFGADDLSPYFVHRDEGILTDMRRRCVEFWTRHVIPLVPPPPSNVYDVFKLWRKAPPTKVEATEEIVELLKELKRAKDAEAVASERQVEVKYEIGKFMLTESGIMLGNKGKLLPGPGLVPGHHLLKITANGTEIPLLDVSLQTQTRIDSERLRHLHPEIAVQCSRETSFFRFDPPRKKK